MTVVIFVEFASTEIQIYLQGRISKYSVGYGEIKMIHTVVRYTPRREIITIIGHFQWGWRRTEYCWFLFRNCDVEILMYNTNPYESNYGNRTSYAEVIKLQKELAKKVISRDCFDSSIRSICGVDVSYKNNIAYCSAVIIDKENFKIIEMVSSESKIKNPYIPSLFILRESEPILQTLKLLTKSFQILLVDGHGVLHPRRCGLACYVGISTNLHTIGVAKSLLCGNVQSNNFVNHDGEILGYALKSTNNLKKAAYISVGHKISLPTSIELVKMITKTNQFVPEPLRVADKLSKEQNSK